MIDLADAIVLNKSDRRGGRTRCATCASSGGATAPAFDAGRRARAGVPDGREPVERPRHGARVRGAGRHPGAARRSRAFANERAAPVRAARQPQAIVPRGARALPRGDRADGARLPRALGARRGRPRRRARARSAWRRRRSATALPPDAARALAARRDAELAFVSPELRADLERWPETRARYDGRRAELRRARARHPGRATTRRPLLGPRAAARGAAAARRAGASSRASCAARICPAASRSRPASSRSSATAKSPRACSPAKAGPSAPTAASTWSRKGQKAVRLSTAFDSVTLYGRDPDPRPDIYGKVGNSGVSVCTVDDAKKLYSGFDLCDPKTSVSMTINGPAPTVLAFFLNAAIDQQVEKHLRERGELEARARALAARGLPRYAGALPDGHNGLGLGLLGIAGDRSRRRRRPTRASAADVLATRARHGAGRHPQGRPGAEHLHLLHRVRAQADGRRAGSTSSRTRAQLLLGVDLRLSHRRGRREPDHAARVHARQRLHVRRELPGARA